MIVIRRSDERGGGNHGWLQTRHTFSFADYYDPEWMGFRSLRVLNEDRVAPGAGFPRHAHQDAEIVSYVLDGALGHEDSIGNGSVIRPGDVQRMSAGTGVTHSEYNHSPSDPVHFLQIWILPDRRGHSPSYEQKAFPAAERHGTLRLIASPDGQDGSVTLHQDVRLYSVLLGSERELRYSLAAGRHAWAQVARGAIALNGIQLSAGDGAAISDETEIALRAELPSELLLFDLA
jgi:redox-sensitive bicupin YhaK (pirin superfamily)